MALGIGVSGLSRGSVDVGVGFIGLGEGSRVSRLHVLIFLGDRNGLVTELGVMSTAAQDCHIQIPLEVVK